MRSAYSEFAAWTGYSQKSYNMILLISFGTWWLKEKEICTLKLLEPFQHH